MISSKQLIKALKAVFNISWYVNVVLAGGAIVFQIINLILKKKMLFASFLGQFSVQNNNLGQLIVSDKSWTVYVDQLMVEPTLLIESNWSYWLILFYTLIVLSVVLFYNYQLKELFKEMHTSVESKELFKFTSVKRFNSMSLFSIIVFVFALTWSVLKNLFIERIYIGHLKLQPEFDHQVFNFLWLAVAFYLIAIIFKVGLDLKHETDLTI